jgi:hypothetical protein
MKRYHVLTVENVISALNRVGKRGAQKKHGTTDSFVAVDGPFKCPFAHSVISLVKRFGTSFLHL